MPLKLYSSKTKCLLSEMVYAQKHIGLGCQVWGEGLDLSHNSVWLASPKVSLIPAIFPQELLIDVSAMLSQIAILQILLSYTYMYVDTY